MPETTKIRPYVEPAPIDVTLSTVPTSSQLRTAGSSFQCYVIPKYRLYLKLRMKYVLTTEPGTKTISFPTTYNLRFFGDNYPLFADIYLSSR